MLSPINDTGRTCTCMIGLIRIVRFYFQPI
nr:MAG TPA: hypothetical protein [Caudoviricetes sp.]